MADSADLAALKAALLANAAAPQSVTIEGVGNARQHDLKDLMDAIKWQAEQDAAANSTNQPFRVMQFRPV